MSKLNQDQELMDSILAKEWHTLYAEEIILIMNYAKEQQAKIDELQKRIDEANQELEGVIRFTQEDVEPNFEYMKLTALNSFARLQESLRGKHENN